MNAVEEVIEFVDSNVILYLISQDEARKQQGIQILQRHPWISVQVLNEVTNVCRNKAKMTWDEVTDFLPIVRHFCSVRALTEAIHDDARRLAKRYQFAFYDACIVAAALSVKASTLWSQDMHEGLVVDGSLTIQNPFSTRAP